MLLSNRTFLVVVPTMNPMVDDTIALIVGASETLSTPVTKEVVADAACGGMWVNRTPGQIIWVGVNGSTPGGTSLAVRSKPDP